MGVFAPGWAIEPLGPSSYKIMNALISVIIPTYNREILTIRAVRSVVFQTYRNWELLLIDDGSSIESWEKLCSRDSEWKNELQKKGMQENKVNLWQIEHAGVGKARNFGVEKSKGDWICFLDSDDEWDPRKLERQMQFHLANPKLNFSQTRERWNKKGNLMEPKGKNQKISGRYLQESLDRCMVTNSSFMAKKEAWLELGGFREELLSCEDYDAWNRIFLANGSIGLLEENLLIRYGGHKDQLSLQFAAMERFRLYSLLLTKEEFQISGNWDLVSEADQRLWNDAILSRFSILLAGRNKRGENTTLLETLRDSFVSEKAIDGFALKNLLTDSYK